MYNITLTQHLQGLAKKFKLGKTVNDQQFLTHFIANIDEIQAIFHLIYGQHPNYSTFFEQLLESIFETHAARSKALKERDEEKAKQGFWYLSNQLMGMSLYVDRFAGNLKGMSSKLDYLQKLGVNYLHLMPIFESPEGESDGGYAVSDFRKVDKRFGSNKDLIDLQKELQAKNMYLMIDIVLNHTSHHHEWAKKAKAGNKEYQDYFYFYDDRKIPDQMDETMPEIFPESSPGSFTYFIITNGI